MDTSLSPLNQTQAQLDANAANLAAYQAANPNTGGGLIPEVNFGAIWDKYIMGNTAADIYPLNNYGGVYNDSPVQGAIDTATNASEQYAGGGVPIGYNQLTYNYPDTVSGSDGTTTNQIDQTYTAPPPDPYAQWTQYGGGTGEQNFNNLVSGFNTQLGGITSTAGNSATNLQGGLNQSVLDTLRDYGRSQAGINKLNVQNESSKIQGGRDIMGMVGRGIKSGGVMLANRNAGNSSAAEAIANAYGQIGQRQLSSVNNQYLMNAEDVGLKQKYLKEDMAAAPGTFHEGIMQNVNSIVSAAQNSLYTLDAQMASASMPDRIAIEQEKEKIKQDALSKLSQYDTQLTTGLGKIAPTTTGANRTTANTQLTAGQADPNLFKYSTQTPSQFQNTGPFASELPIFTYPYNKTKQTA